MQVVDALKNWVNLNEFMKQKDLQEEALWHLLEMERTGKARMQFMLRIYGRANRLRTKRERLALIKTTRT